MKTFKYEAIADSGAKITGVTEAEDKVEALAKLKEQYAVVNSLNEVVEMKLNGKLFEKKKLNMKHLALVCEQFSIILGAGMPIVQTIDLVAMQTEDKSLRTVLEGVSDDVSGGSTMADSFAARGTNLPVTFIETVRAGEESGHLEESFDRLCKYFTKRNASRSKVISALTYPALVLFVAAVVIGIIMIYAVPIFSNTFLDMGIELPFATKALIAVSNFMTKYFLLGIGLIVVLVVCIRMYAMTEQGGITLSKLLTKMPIIGKIQLMSAAAQFSTTLSTMLVSGIPVIRAMEITGKAMTNKYISQSVLGTLENIEGGVTVGEALHRAGTLPGLLVEMTAVGEEAGSMEKTLSVISAYYDNEVDTATSRAVSVLEPLIICFLAVFVVFVLLAVYMPMFSMYGSM